VIGAILSGASAPPKRVSSRNMVGNRITV